MSDLYKFGWLPGGQSEERYVYPNVWAIEKTTGSDRLVIAPRDHYIRLLLLLAKCLEQPYFVLYVLTVPRGGGEAGRYESKVSFGFDELEYFLYEYSELLEHDSRNSLWIQSRSGLLVYDLHNVIYAYGALEEFKNTLESNGLHEAGEVRFPSPHVHRYHFQFDDDQAHILRDNEWIHTPLRPGDENPNDA
jgi:hypothetical protein